MAIWTWTLCWCSTCTTKPRSRHVSTIRVCVYHENVCDPFGEPVCSVVISGRFTAGCSPVVDAGGTYWLPPWPQLHYSPFSALLLPTPVHLFVYEFVSVLRGKGCVIKFSCWAPCFFYWLLVLKMPNRVIELEKYGTPNPYHRKCFEKVQFRDWLPIKWTNASHIYIVSVIYKEMLWCMVAVSQVTSWLLV